MEMLSPPEETARREEEQEELEQEEVQEVQDQEEEEEDFCEAAVATAAPAAALAKIKAGHKEDTANIICALLFHIILLFDSHKRFTFVSVTPIYVVHIMLNVKRKSLPLPLPLPLSSSSNNRSTRTRNDNETNNDDTQAPISLCVSFAKMGACVCAMWIMRSIFYNDEEFMEGICWAVWITGSIFNLQFLTHDINSLGAVHVAARHQIRPVFHVLSLTVGWVANILCLMGIVFGGFDMNHGIYGSIPHVFLTVGLLVYIIHSILFGLSICYGHILYECFSDERLLDIIRSRGHHEGEGGENNNDDDDICHRLRKDDMVKITCLFLMPVLIVTGNGSGKYRIVEAVFIGGVLYMLYTILEMRTRKANGASSAITTIGTFGGIMLCIGSVFFCALDDWSIAAFGAFWMIGCFCNLFVLNSDLGELTGASRDGQARPLFKVMFVWTSLVGNILNVIGCALIAFRFNPEVGGFLLGCGFIFFFIQPFFLALSIIYGHVVFLIHISTPADQPAAGMEEFKIPLLDKKNDISCDTIITEYE